MKYVYPDTILTTLGHVDHGKTTLLHALTGVWVARHSEELKRAMTIKLGYVTANIYECQDFEYRYLSDGLLKNGRCHDGGEPRLVRRISILDVPGHEILISVMVSGISFVDGAIMVIDASVPCPQPQTSEHFTVASLMGVRRMIVVQNKIDLVTKDKALENFYQIKQFLKGTWASSSPIIPVSALHKVNVDVLPSLIHRYFPPQERTETSKSPRFHVLRSFNVNRPGTPPEKLVGGVVGGVLSSGELRVGDEVEIRPGLKVRDKYIPIHTVITSIAIGSEFLEYARPGALIAIGTKLDPALTKADSLVGSVVGRRNEMPPVWSEIVLEYHPVKLGERGELSKIGRSENIMVSVGSSTTFGVARDVKGDTVTISLRRAVCADPGAKVVVIKQMGTRWRVAGWGELVDGKVLYERR